MRRLTDLRTDGPSQQLQRLHNTYDLVGNMLGEQNNVPLPPPPAWAGQRRRRSRTTISTN